LNKMSDRADRSSFALVAKYALVVPPLKASLASVQHADSFGSMLAPQSPAGSNCPGALPTPAEEILLQSVGVGALPVRRLEIANPTTNVWIECEPLVGA